MLGREYVLSDPELKAPYERDWTGRYRGSSRLVVRPRDTGQIARVMEVCASHCAPVVPQGGNTGLVGASVPRGREVVLSLRRLLGIGPYDRSIGQVTAGAGVTLAALQAGAGSAGMDAALDFAARDTSTLGGILACDAGGARALRYGTARARVAGLEAVLADGSVISRLSGTVRDNAGYDIPSLLVGSEGTLGVITRVRWRLEPRLDRRVAALIPPPSARHASGLLASLRTEAPSLESCDFFLDDGLQLVLKHQARESPLRTRAHFYLLLECAGRSDPTDELAAALRRAGIDDALMADDTFSRARLWALREGHTEAINALGIAHKLDVGLPLDQLPRFLDLVPDAVGRAAGAQVILFGHLGSGNVHVNVLGADPADVGLDDAVLELTLACGGTISAEHGVGVAKARWLPRALGGAELAAMSAIKRALDPENLLNPGAVLASEP